MIQSFRIVNITYSKFSNDNESWLTTKSLISRGIRAIIQLTKLSRDGIYGTSNDGWSEGPKSQKIDQTTKAGMKRLV